ncbi:MAG: serine/threonine protein kinase, partial [Planctomycetaceae bacterium]
MSEDNSPDPHGIEAREPTDNGLLNAEIDRACDRLEAAWQAGTTGSSEVLADYLPEGPAEKRRAFLIQLIAVDLEYRWKAGKGILLDDYTGRFSELSCLDDLPLELIMQEFQVRHCWGDQPSFTDFAKRFPGRREELEGPCDRITANAVGRISPVAIHDEVSPKLEGTIVTPDLPPDRTADDVAGPSPEQSFQTLAAGMHVSHYLLQSKIGEGGCGIVFLAENIDRPYERCALKLIRPDRLNHGKVALRFQQEIQALTGLSHANIVCATGSGDWKGISYLVMEYVEGQSLDDIIERRGATAIAEACELVRQAAVGVQYLHESKLTHRDIKPSNLILTPDGVVKILDLGLARLMDIDDPEERLTSIGDMMGTPDYMAPEQWKDSSNVDIRGDIYSLGCTLYCLLTGSAPYSAQKSHHPMSLMKAHSKSPIPDIQKMRNDVPLELSELIQSCLGKRPDERPDTPQVLVEKLARFTVDASLPSLLGTVTSSSGLPATSVTHVEHVDEKGTIAEDAADCSSDGAAGNSLGSEPVDSQTVEVKSTSNEDSDQLNAQKPEDVVPAPAKQETLIEGSTSPLLSAREQTLLERKDEFEGTLAEQTIKPRNPASSPVTPGSGQRNAVRGSVGSFTTFSSVVVRQREVTTSAAGNSPAAEYEIGSKLGEGGMGAVFQARQGSIDRTVALKMIKGQRIPQSMQEAFLAEAVVTGALEHPNIVPIYDLGANPGGELFYAMKEVRGRPWKDTIDQVGDETNLEVLLKVTDAIAFAHSRGVVHRDLKPDNVMIGEFGEVIVMDWGLAFPTSEFDRPGLAVTKGLAGTPSYMSPEMAEAKNELIGPKSDVYLLGGQLFRAITGGPPHTGKHAYAALHAAAENEITWPDDTEMVNSELLAIARKAMATAPQDRYESAIDFQQALRDYRSHSESRRLAEFALSELEAGELSGEYRRFEKAIVGLEEAIQLWLENDRAIEALKTARM